MFAAQAADHGRRPRCWRSARSSATRRSCRVFVLAGAARRPASTIDNVTRSAIIPALAGDRLRAALSLNYGLYQVAAVRRARRSAA